MAGTTRTIEVFSAGCPVCEPVVEQIRDAACPSCDVEVLDVNEPESTRRARELGVASVPAVAVDGRLAGCCEDGGPDLDVLREAGLGRPLA